MYDFIKKRLKELGKTQRELAQAMKIEPPHLSAIFGGTRLIKSSEILPIADFLELNSENLIKYLAGKISEEQLLTIPIKHLFKVGYVQAGKFNEACQLPEDEWESVPYPVNADYRKCHLFALGVKGLSMNKIFPPDNTTLICCPVAEWYKVNKDIDISGRYIIAYRKDANGLCEASVKRYEKTSDDTAMLFAESTEDEFKYPIILHPDKNEYEIAAVVIGYMRNC